MLGKMKANSLARDQLAMVLVVPREWAAKNPHAAFKSLLSKRRYLWPPEQMTTTRSFRER